MNLFGNHALALNQGLALFFATDAPNGIERLLGIFGPDHFGAPASNGGLEKLELLIERGDCFPFSILGSFTGQLQVHELLLTLWYDGIVLANVEIDLATVFPIGGLDGTLR